MNSERIESDWSKYREMSDELRKLCIESILNTPAIPEDAKEHKDTISNCEISCFDASYLEFLDSQIKLKPRGPEWSQVLERRREAFTNFVDRELARCTISSKSCQYIFRIDPLSSQVIHWESEEL